jgi:hypothetical protein
MTQEKDKREEEAAAAEAARIGGDVNYEDIDEAQRPLTESGEGVSEGYELAEEDHRRNAEHDDGQGNPLRDAPEAEAEGDRPEQVYGEADHVHATGGEEDPAGSGDEDGEGEG